MPHNEPNTRYKGGRKNYAGNSSRAVDIFDLYTGGKLPELAIFYNVACDNVNRFIRSVGNITDPQPIKKPDALDDQIMSYLREYLWKGSEMDKNSSGHAITDDGKRIIRELLKKLDGIRNFQSHVWCDNAVLEFNEELVDFINARHDHAVHKLENDPNQKNDARLYLEFYMGNAQKKMRPNKLFDFKEGKYFMTQDGRRFLLSFFLYKGQMSLLLQQSTGSKRNDIPEFQFKQKLYRYYCHREGAAIESTGKDDEQLATIHDEKKDAILKGKQAFKLINYINDKPAYYNDENSLPLYFRNEQGEVKTVTGMPSLKEYLETGKLLTGISIQLRELEHTVDDGISQDERAANERQKQLERKRREGMAIIELKENPDYSFEINYGTLRHIVSDVVLGRTIEKDIVENDEAKEITLTAEQHFYQSLNAAIENRKYIYDILKNAPSDIPLDAASFKIKRKLSSAYINYKNIANEEIFNVDYTSDQLRHLSIHATPKLEELLIEWHYAFTNGKSSETKKRKYLLNYLRPLSAAYDSSVHKMKDDILGVLPENTSPHPLVYLRNQYYKEQDQKPREEDNFLSYAVQYLIDFNLLPDCFFEVEKYVYSKKFNEPESEYKLKKELDYVQQVPENYRLRIIDNHINIAVKNTKSSNPVFIKLRLGEKALKYIIYACTVPDNRPASDKSVNDLLITLAADCETMIENILSGTNNDYRLLEPFAIPDSYLKSDGGNKKATDARGEITTALQKKINWIDEQLAQKGSYNRHQKNDAILKAYTFFDFGNTDHKKFLRKNEYGQMSICHFLLNQNATKVMGTIEYTFGLRNRLPLELLDIISAITNQINEDKNTEPGLDMLFNQILKNRKKVMTDFLEKVADEKLDLKELEYLNLKLSDANLPQLQKEKRQHNRREGLLHIPFAVHPALVLKYFYPQDFKAKKFDGNAQNESGATYTNPFLEMRNNRSFTTILVTDYYDTNTFKQVFEKANAIAITNTEKTMLDKQYKKLVGKITDTFTKDMFISRLAEQYLFAYDDTIAAEFKQIRNSKRISIAGLFSKENTVALMKNDAKIKYSQQAGEQDDETQTTYTQAEYDAMPTRIYISLRLHNADDYFYKTQKDKLYRLALHYINFRKEELEHYKNQPEFFEKLSKWPDGTELKPIPVGHLLQEQKNIANMANRLAEYIIQYEKNIITGYVAGRQQADKSKSKQDCMLAISKGLNYLSFEKIATLDTATAEKTKTDIRQLLRNNCMHNGTPLTASYSKLALPGTAAAITLQIEKRLAPDREKYKLYEQEAKTGNL